MKRILTVLLILTITIMSLSACGIFKPSEQPNVPEVTTNEENQEQQSDQLNEDEVKEVNGIYVGQIDGNSIEINIDNNPGAFVTTEVQEQIDKLQEGSRVKIQYFENEYGQLILKSIETIE